MRSRKLSDVLDTVIQEIPEEFSGVLVDLRSLRQSVQYTAPELMRLRWIQLSEILNDGLPDPTSTDAPEWAKHVSSLVMGEGEGGVV